MNPTPRDIHFEKSQAQNGTLSLGEHPGLLPFSPVRFFTVSGVNGDGIRGRHAHKYCEQILVCVSGEVLVGWINDAGESGHVLLNSSHIGLYVPPMIWAEQHYKNESTVPLVLASKAYSVDDYIYEWEPPANEFLNSGSPKSP